MAGMVEPAKVYYRDDLPVCALRGLTQLWTQQWARLLTLRGLLPFPAEIPPVVVRLVTTLKVKSHGTLENRCARSRVCPHGLNLGLTSSPSSQGRKMNVVQRLAPTIEIVNDEFTKATKRGVPLL